MADIRRMLSEEERAEYDQLHYDATHDELGKLRPSAEFGPEMKRRLADAAQAGRKWAEWVLDDALLDGLCRRGKSWLKLKEIIETVLGGRVVTKAAIIGVRRRDEDGVVYHQQVAWPEMTADELQQVIDTCSTRVLAERQTIAIARRLLQLLDRMREDTVAAALSRIGKTLDEFLSEEEDVA